MWAPSRLLLGEAPAARIRGNRASALDAEPLDFDSSTFDAYVADNQEAMEDAERRVRSEFQVALDASMATDLFTERRRRARPLLHARV